MYTNLDFLDMTSETLFRPKDTITPIKDFPSLCVSTFSDAIINVMASVEGVKTIGALYTATGEIPIYQITYTYKGHSIAFYKSFVGAPACVACYEEILALGAKSYVLFGCCAVLQPEVVTDQILIPTSTCREEGTSYHYVSANTECKQPEAIVAALSTVMEENRIPYVKGKIWTTDAIYRETKQKIVDKRKEGCLAVEMECAAMLAVSAFRKTTFGQFLYPADSFTDSSWQINDLTTYGVSSAEKYFYLACECVIALDKIREEL